MLISSDVFEAYLDCPTKCWFRFRGAEIVSNRYSQWVETQNQSYRIEAFKQLLDNVHQNDSILAPTKPLNIKKSTWRLAADFVVRKDNLESRIFALERLSLKGKPDQYLPIRSTFSNKIAKRDKLLIAYDSLVLSEAFRQEIKHGRIIYGTNFSMSKVKVPPLMREVRKSIGKISAMIEDNLPPELVLNRHCPVCDFQAMCRKKAVEKDDLSLLAGMKEKERKKFNGKGIFTITQLSYTFRPRRRSKRSWDKREKYHHSLKALAIREKKIHIVGSPEIVINGTPIYLDVECVPDRDFYYLVGMLIKHNHSLVRHSLWAESPGDEATIWQNFLEIISLVEKPVLIHYGSLESNYLKQMCRRYGGPPEGSASEKAIKESVNILSITYAQIYFPVFGNGLKDIAGFLGYTWMTLIYSGRSR